MTSLFILVTHTPLGRLQTPTPTLLDSKRSMMAGVFGVGLACYPTEVIS